ncbi:hypothetical protein Xsto_04068 [Xenorhabdus stockiae]|uniref:Protein ninX n=1 Tax=Xenorhabdus stockiae TaxID=351614 RepID=A0A2D0K6W4_9GAMM|nr:phage protein NinX family protein [Xenorhabdus stockiae]PHM59122.1 hypothetical protein Xsto_04068 [Xenorhabdus stockiae]
MDYSQLSDFEINKLVAEKFNILQCMFCANDSEEMIWNVSSGDNYGGFISKRGRAFDPCNNPSESMPIIIKYGISLIFQDRKFHYASNDGEIECFLDNPYKAAMVIFLHMKDMENER